MTGAIVIWYLVGAMIIAMVVLDVRGQANKVSGSSAAFGPLLWLAMTAAGVIFALWPWVALNLATNASL